VSKKYAEKIGRQTDGTWVLGKGAYFNANGELISLAESKFVWISNILSAPGIALITRQCSINKPLSTAPLVDLMTLLECTMKQFLCSSDSHKCCDFSASLQ